MLTFSAPHFSQGSQAPSAGFDIGQAHSSPTEPEPRQRDLCLYVLNSDYLSPWEEGLEFVFL